jgi:hypothetical protein
MFRFANVEGRSALVDSDDRWFDASRVSCGVISADPMGAWLQLEELHLAAGAIAEALPDGTSATLTFDRRSPRPGACSLSGSTIGRMWTSPR